ncbi:MAG: hypothetical protein GY697_16650, partial [Desulfobacterales bacterium]|nr:hypothetical protein [Desulfobacterales bacterium]
MRRNTITLIILIAFLLAGLPAVAADNPADAKKDITLDDVLKKVEKRYALSGFTADFFQSSTLK